MNLGSGDQVGNKYQLTRGKETSSRTLYSVITIYPSTSNALFVYIRCNMVNANEQYASDMGIANITGNYGNNTFHTHQEMARTLQWMSSNRKDRYLHEGFWSDSQTFMTRLLPLLVLWPVVHQKMQSTAANDSHLITVASRCSHCNLALYC